MDKIMVDLEKFERLGQRTEGCSSGQHMFNYGEDSIGGSVSGEGMKCVLCGQLFGVPGVEVQIQNPQPQISTGTPFGGSGAGGYHEEPSEQSDILKRILR